jgi:hypothetical protein
MISLHVVCDECGFHENAEATTKNWVNLNVQEKEYHLCCKSCILKFIGGDKHEQ